MPTDPWMWLVGVLGLALTILNVIDRVVSFKKMAKAPFEEQNIRINGLESKISDIELRLKRHDEFFTNDKTRLDSIEKEAKQVNTIMIKSLQALTEHALNGSNAEQLHECSKEMNEYLLNR